MYKLIFCVKTIGTINEASSRSAKFRISIDNTNALAFFHYLIVGRLIRPCLFLSLYKSSVCFFLTRVHDSTQLSRRFVVRLASLGKSGEIINSPFRFCITLTYFQKKIRLFYILNDFFFLF